MKILFTSDLHGRKKLYDGLIRTCIEESVDAVILGGDLLPREKHLAESLNLQMSNLLAFKVGNRCESLCHPGK